MSVRVDTDLLGTSEAIFSEDDRYRYTLRRRWEGDKESVLFMMLNPSTADAMEDDPTIRRCIGFAKHWGFGGLIVWNLYALRATNPNELLAAADPVGPENDVYLPSLLAASGYVVAAWGVNPNLACSDRDESALCRLIDVDVYCLGRWGNGQPRHPLYVPANRPAELLCAAGMQSL